MCTDRHCGVREVCGLRNSPYRFDNYVFCDTVLLTQPLLEAFMTPLPRNRTGTLPAVGPFRDHPKPQPKRCVEKHIAVKCGDKPGNRRVVLAPAEVFGGLASFPGLYV